LSKLLCDECRDGNVKNSGIVSGKYWDGMSETCGLERSATSAGMECQKLGYYVASTGTVKSGNLCGRCRVCSGADTEMSSCIFSGSKGQREQLGCWGNQASGR
jgi:hypothetical protein